MNNLEKKQSRLEKLTAQYEKFKARTEQLCREIKELTKEIEMDSMADLFQEGKINKMTVSDWKYVKSAIASGDLQQFLKQKYGEQAGYEEKKMEGTADNENE
ncbi:MAG: hypothetical protein LUI12_10010 [Clostridiales bacterium]|nr:hypothetical protein [Clostridiales bacterium]